VVVVTRDGEVLSGVLRDDAAQELLLATGVNTVERIPRDRVLEVRPGETSIMPAALETQLSTEELADLIAFLRAAQR
jgi:putative heme-binding domain-containing protein